MIIPGNVSLQCVSWNIAGKYELFSLKQLQLYIERYDIICLTETHATQSGSVNFPNYKVFEFPDYNCNHEYPRGGICLLVKHEIKNYIKSVSLLMTDFVEIVFTNDLRLINLYIPPVDSAYYDEQYIELLCSMFVEADIEKRSLISMGDLNVRLGNLNSISNDYTF